jgi:3-methyladenine DNA glycosylase AlkD
MPTVCGDDRAQHEEPGGFGGTDRTLLICGVLADDRDDLVVMAESWALRSHAPWDPPAVVAFLERHDLRLAARVSVRSATSSVR